MERLQKIFSTWAKQENEKTELASEKVELTLVADINKALKQLQKNQAALQKVEADAKKAYNKFEDKLQAAYGKAVEDQIKLNDTIKAAIGNSRGPGSILDKAEKAAKQLGLSAKDIPNFQALATIFDNIQDDIQNAKRAVAQIDTAKL